jgi:hypothetical protein
VTILLMGISSITPAVIATCLVVRDRLKLSFLRKVMAEHGIEHLASAAAAVEVALARRGRGN